MTPIRVALLALVPLVVLTAGPSLASSVAASAAAEAAATSTDRSGTPAVTVPAATVILTTDTVRPTEDAESEVRELVRDRLARDRAAMERHRPGHPFWAHVFAVPDGSVAFGSAVDGRLLATFPVDEAWDRAGRWQEEGLARLLQGRDLPRRVSDRRDEVAAILEQAVGPVVHNPTRGDFLRPSAERYGSFVAEWGRIYERFGVPAEIGLAQAVIESGLSGTVRSEARAMGLCQWLPRNWDLLDRLTDDVIEVENQTTQAAFCAAHLSVLATKYGSFIPALSEHHAGTTNVGRTVINGERLGASDIRTRYLVGAEFARDVRAISRRTYRDVVGTYGPRSFLYSEMVFGNARTVREIEAGAPQEEIHAMRAPRDLPVAEVARASGVSVDEVKRYNPALVRRVPEGAAVYLPAPVEALGPDVAFWHRPAPPEFATVLHDFVRLDEPLETWEDPSFTAVLEGFRQRFRATGTEEGAVMDAVLGYVVKQMPGSRRILAAYRTDRRIVGQFERASRARIEAMEAAGERE